MNNLAKGSNIALFIDILQHFVEVVMSEKVNKYILPLQTHKIEYRNQINISLV
jgi:hypothetical protein